MTKAVFTTKVVPGYKDLPEARYHFPRTYLNQVRQSAGDHVVYCEPRRSSVDLSSFGGRQSYFGVARVVDVVEDNELALQLHFLLEVRSLCFGLVSASPERPCDDASGLDTSLRELEGDTTDFLD